jgi:hypothetical protein
VLPVLAPVLAVETNPTQPDTAAAAILMVLTATVVTVLAWRAPRGTPASTVLRALVGYGVGMLAAGAAGVPSLGYLAAYVPVVLIVARRYGFAMRVSRTPKRGHQPGTPAALTGRDLADWAAQYPPGEVTVLAHRQMPRAPFLAPAEHVVVSKRGTAVVASTSTSTSETRTRPGTAPDPERLHGPLDLVAQQAEVVANALGTAVSAVLVVHGSRIPDGSYVADVLGGQVTVSDPSALRQVLATTRPGPRQLSARRAGWRAKRHLAAVPLPRPSSEPPQTSEERTAPGVRADVLADPDTRPRTVVPGMRVIVTTENGVWIDMRAVTGPYDLDGVDVIDTATESEWYAARREGRAPKTNAWPAGCVRPE